MVGKCRPIEHSSCLGALRRDNDPTRWSCHQRRYCGTMPPSNAAGSAHPAVQRPSFHLGVVPCRQHARGVRAMAAAAARPSNTPDATARAGETTWRCAAHRSRWPRPGCCRETAQLNQSHRPYSVFSSASFSGFFSDTAADPPAQGRPRLGAPRRARASRDRRGTGPVRWDHFS